MLIGRQHEKAFFDRLIKQSEPVFLVVYGRRRVGKTYFIKNYFSHTYTFYHTGLANANTEQQLDSFNDRLLEYFGVNEKPDTWMKAFTILRRELSKTQGQRIIFIDELPWMDTPKSDFLTALEWFWNYWASTEEDLKLIVCGSAASWMIDNLLSNTKGLYNRVTDRLKMYPFTLAEVAEYLAAKNIVWEKYQIAQLYMALGGIPFYLSYAEKGESVPQLIDRLCFAPNGPLRHEFSFVLASLFKKADKYEAIVEAIFNLKGKATRDNISAATGIATSGDFSKKLDELEESGFIKSHLPIGGKKTKKYYSVSDYFSKFHFSYIKHGQGFGAGHWLTKVDSPGYYSWQGRAFEQICYDHLDYVKKQLGITGLHSINYASFIAGNEEIAGAQLDLIIDRNDGIINVCEIKFSANQYTITKDYNLKLRNKIEAYRAATKTKKAIHLVMITSFGLVANEYEHSVVKHQVLLEHLF